jgi:hypothetical protein
MTSTDAVRSDEQTGATAAGAQPVVTGPIGGGAKGWPFGGPLLDLARYGYREEEYFIEGAATRYRPVPGTDLGHDRRWQAEPAGTAPYKTRLVVYRPNDPARFNGTVIVTWNNVTAGYDLFNTDNLEIYEGGFVLVGVTAQRVGIEGLPPASQGLAAWDAERYGTLSHPGDDYSYDIFTQAARAVGPDRARQPVDPLAGLEVRHVIAQGASQSAGRLATYVNAIQPLSRAFDGFILTIYFGRGTPLEVGDQVVNINDRAGQPSPDEALRGSNLLRDDLDAPVMVVNSELEAIACYGVRQPDSDRFRYWEAAGTCHVSEQGQRARVPKYERDFGALLPVAPGINRVPMVPLFEAAFHHMHRWLDEGTPPPVQPRIEFAGDPPQVVRDENGIARGGIRLPQVEVPIAQNSAIPLAPDIWAFLGGSCHPFPPEKLRDLYGDKRTYLARFEAAARAAEAQGVLLPRDVEALIEEARVTYPA